MWETMTKWINNNKDFKQKLNETFSHAVKKVKKTRKGYLPIFFGGARCAMVIVAGYGHGDTSSNPGPDWLHFT